MPESRGARRRAIARERENEATRKRTTLKVLGGLGLAGLLTYIGYEVASEVSANSKISPTVEKFKQELTVPTYPVDGPQLLSPEWFNPIELSSEYSTAPTAKTASDYLNFVTEKMTLSQYQPFVQAANLTIYRLNKEGKNLKNGDFLMDIEEIPPKPGTNTAIMFYTRVVTSDKKTWQAQMLFNSFWTRPELAQVDPSIASIWNPFSIATFIGHEVIGHYLFYEKLISMLTSQGVSVNKAVETAMNFPNQEGYAYAVTAEMIRPFSSTVKLETILPTSIVGLVREWEKYRDLPGGWYHPDWVNITQQFEHSNIK